ncbi:MAG TPA: T9SS type B sorting domain-containing protein [Leeuwenhoekiella sp.]|nr:T9SS type B sorting domain-containing protein [Leeuwenhoekiella sp.]
MKSTLTFLLYFACISLGFGQGAANNWYFGSGAGISFETSPPTVLTNGNLNTLEGCSTISNDNGQLLFYTDGTIIYQADGSVMTNGAGLLGDSSSTQSAIIIPKPLDTNIYYVFTVDVLEQFDPNGPLETDGINYSIVDFSTNPQGEVTEKNIHLLDFSAEKLSAVVMGCDSDTVWMVSLSTSTGNIPFSLNQNINLNTFYAFAITENGIETTPVKSTTGMQVTDQRGNLKFSPDGKKLACANVVSGLYLLDFNSLTGQVSNAQSLGSYEAIRDAYGVEFSPNNRFLYVANYNDLPINAPASQFNSVLRQYDLESNSINGSVYVVDQQNLYRSSLQLGPDGKIYRSMSTAYFSGRPYLSVIENPNEKGAACGYVNNAVNLGSGMSTQGLPPFNQSLFNRVDVIQNNVSTSTLNLCDDETYTLRYDAISEADYQWSKNGQDIPGATSNELPIALQNGATLPQSDVYKLSVDLNDGTCPRIGIANVNYYRTPELPENPLVLSQCEDAETADGLSLFNLKQIERMVVGNDPSFTFTYYENNQAAQVNDTTQAINPIGYANTTANQTLYVYLTNPAACSLVVPFELNVSSTVANSATLTACDVQENGYNTFDLSVANAQLLAGQSPTIDITYYSTPDAALLEDENQQLPVSYENITPYEDTVYARLENNEQCFAISEIVLVIFPLPDVAPIADEIICANLLAETVTISPEYNLDPSYDYTYLWMPTGQTTLELITREPGTHTLTVTNTTTGCSRSRSVVIETRSIATIDDIEVIDASANNQATIIISGMGDFEFALDEMGPYQDSNVFTNLLPGFYTVFVRAKEGCGSVSQDFSVIGFDKFFTPNGDGYNDRWQVEGISATIQPGTSIRIFDRYGKLLKELNPLSEGWDGTFNGKALASDDYWFRVVLEDGREFKSHFTLKR